MFIAIKSHDTLLNSILESSDCDIVDGPIPPIGWWILVDWWWSIIVIRVVRVVVRVCWPGPCNGIRLCVLTLHWPPDAEDSSHSQRGNK